MGRTRIRSRFRGHQPSGCSTSFAHTFRSSRWLRLEWADSSSGLGRGREGRPKKGERASRGVNGRTARSSRTSDCPKHGENLMTEPMEVSTNASGRRVANGSYRKEVRPAVESSAAQVAPGTPSTLDEGFLDFPQGRILLDRAKKHGGVLVIASPEELLRRRPILSLDPRLPRRLRLYAELAARFGLGTLDSGNTSESLSASKAAEYLGIPAE